MPVPVGDSYRREDMRRQPITTAMGISLAALGLLAGGLVAAGDTDRVQSDAAATRAPPANSVGTKQIRDRSLLFRDFKRRQIYSLRQINDLFLRSKVADQRFLKIIDAAQTYLRIVDASQVFLRIADANQTFLKLDGTAANSQQLEGIPASGFVRGQGNVFSGTLTLASGQEQPLLVAPGFFQVDAHTLDGAGYTIRNLSGGSVRVVETNTDTAADPAVARELAPGGSDTEFFGGSTGNATIQVVPVAGGQVGTFIVSWLPAGGFASQFIGQALVGTP